MLIPLLLVLECMSARSVHPGMRRTLDSGLLNLGLQNQQLSLRMVEVVVEKRRSRNMIITRPFIAPRVLISYASLFPLLVVINVCTYRRCENYHKRCITC